MNKKGSVGYISIYEDFGDIAVKGYAYVIISNCILYTGGYS